MQPLAKPQAAHYHQPYAHKTTLLAMAVQFWPTTSQSNVNEGQKHWAPTGRTASMGHEDAQMQHSAHHVAATLPSTLQHTPAHLSTQNQQEAPHVGNSAWSQPADAGQHPHRSSEVGMCTHSCLIYRDTWLEPLVPSTALVPLLQTLMIHTTCALW